MDSFHTEVDLVMHCSISLANLTFVDEYDHSLILPSTIRLYSKNVPVRDAA